MSAKELAKEAHRWQKDKLGEPYFFHLQSVAKLTRIYLDNHFDEHIIALAYLHDIVEDQDVTLNDLLKMGFPQELVDDVDRLTKRPYESRADYLTRVCESRRATIVKVCDNKHNTLPTRRAKLAEIDPETASRVYKKYLNDMQLIPEEFRW